LFYSTRSKLIVSFLAVSLLVCGVALLVGGQLLYKAFLNEAYHRAGLELNAGREIYASRILGIRQALGVTQSAPEFRAALARQDASGIVPLLRDVAGQTRMDFAGIVTRDNRTLCRMGPNAIPKDASPPNPIADLVLKKHVHVSGTLVLDPEFLFAEDPTLADRAGIKMKPTERAGTPESAEQLSGMALAAAVPVFENGAFLGVLYGGVLLNRNEEIVDRICDTLFRHEIYSNRSVGTASIFLKDTRISTNIVFTDGSRAIGTVASGEVVKRVLTQGKQWIDRAFWVNDWYITASEPIEDILGRRVGMLCVGVLEAKYADVRRKALSIFVLITLAGMALALGLGYLIADRISKPVRQLIDASVQVSRGNLSPDTGSISKGEIGVLQKTFHQMLASIQERDKRQKVESETKLLQSEKQASIGKLAGGVAHEINNPLTGVVTFTHMLLKRKDLPEDVRSDLETIAQETERVRKIVKGLLDFSRQSQLDPEPTDINRLIRHTISLVENQALIKGVTLSFEHADGLPMITVDRNQMQSVFLNIIINALDATDTGGSIKISTSAKMRMAAGKAGQKGIEIAITDTGCGIPPEIMDKLFDPFFTTKDVGRGTGLGLSVSHGIVERHGGTVLVQSKPQSGSTFFVWLPGDEQVLGNENTNS